MWWFSIPQQVDFPSVRMILSILGVEPDSTFDLGSEISWSDLICNTMGVEIYNNREHTIFMFWKRE